ncbi:unnamed protein product [Trifolium pratense]|uniref:Uncharacterized protein n=1 Tax=Trifolium pratense TaxID=57577 RepID=A0ACB0MDM8_TRIPR|nr:unnamed protein product [Trifolium pratense]
MPRWTKVLSMMLSLLAALLEFQKYYSCCKRFSRGRNYARASTLTRLLLMVQLSRLLCYVMVNFKNVPNLVLRDVTPLSIGVLENGDIMDFFITKNTSIPFKKTKEHETIEDNQDFVDIRVYEGERLRASDNNLLGSIKLSILPAPRGHHVEISLAIDENGILIGSVKEKSTGSKKKITITNEK